MRKQHTVHRADITPKSRVVTCAECGSPMVLRWTEKYQRWFYGCSQFPACKACHGAHPNGEPLGTPADADGKVWRRKAHAVIDPIWQSLPERWRSKGRGRVYKWLRDQWPGRKSVHIAGLTAAECQELVGLVERAQAAGVSIIGDLWKRDPNTPYVVPQTSDRTPAQQAARRRRRKNNRRNKRQRKEARA